MSDRLSVSVCYLLKDEEPLFERSLASIAPYVAEIIVVDLGASAQMLEIAQNYTTRISEFGWNNSFADARNFAAELANEEWILMMNPDEVFEFRSLELLKTAIQQTDFFAFQIALRSYTNNVYTLGYCSIEPDSSLIPTEASTARGYFELLRPALYRNCSGIVWEGLIGETILPSTERLGLRHSILNIILHRFFHLKSTHSLLCQRRLELELGLKRLQQNKSDAKAWHDYAQILTEVGEYSRAKKSLGQALAIKPDWPEAELLLARLLIMEENFPEAERALRKLRFRSQSPAEVHGQLSTALLYQHKLSEALQMAQMASQLDPDLFVANLNCGIILYEKGEPERALDYFQKAHRANPDDSFVRGAISRLFSEVFPTRSDNASRQNH